MDLAAMRERYGRDGIDVGDLDPDPLAQLRAWFADWAATGAYDANAVTLATVAEDGTPEARVVLVKAIDDRGVVFYTNRRSAKGRALSRDDRAALCFAWLTVERQARLVGRATPVPDAESDAYFASRPRGSQLGAWASPQSEVIADRSVLEAARDDAAARFPDVVPRPDHWGGYVVAADTLELWQGRPDRLHDRLRYRRGPGGDWLLERLAP